MTDSSRAYGREAALDDDRLPWLESVDDDDGGDGTSAKIVALIVALLIAVAVAVGGVWLLRHRTIAPSGDGKLIVAPQGNYKARPDGPGGMKVEGQGDSAFATSEGAEADGKIDLNAAPETPIAAAARPPERRPTGPAKSSIVTPIAASGGKLVATPPARPIIQRGGAAAEGSTVQLGSFNSAFKANEAWVTLAKRFSYLAPLTKTVAMGTVNGVTVYRLRASGADDAAAVCAKLKIAGENCLLVN